MKVVKEEIKKKKEEKKKKRFKGKIMVVV